MTTGDIKNNLRKLQTEIRLIKYSETIDVANLSKGVPTAFLPLYHYAFTQYSSGIAEKISSMDIELFGKTDLRFMEAVYKILRDMFKYKPLITKDQFFSAGFAERKVIMSTEVLSLIRAMKKELQPPSKPTSSLRVNSSMDSLNKLPGLTQHKSADSRRISMIETSKAKKIAKESIGRTNRTGKAETFKLTRPTSAPTGRPPKAIAVKHKELDEKEPNLDFQDSQVYGGTPSIIRVRPAAVEVVRLPREGEIDASSRIPTNDSSRQTESITKLTNQMSDLFKMVDEVVSRVSLLEIPETKIASPVGHSSMIQHHEPTPPTVDVKSDITQIKQQQETILARLVLLENRMAMMESKMVPYESQAPAISVINCDSPVSTVKNSNKGAFVSVESFVHGDKLVKKFQPSPDTPVQAVAQHNEYRSVPPPILQLNGGGHVDSYSLIRSETLDSDAQVTVTPDNATSPTEVKADMNPCQYIDESTQNKVERIKNLFNETDGMLKNIGVANPLLPDTNTNQQAKDLDADVDEKELESYTEN